METNQETPEEQPVVEQVEEQVLETAADVLKDPEVQALVASFKEPPAAPEETELGEVAEEEVTEGEVEQTEETPEAPTETSWIEGRDRHYAAALGLTAEELAEFESRAELERFGKMLIARQSHATPSPEPKQEAKAPEYIDQPILDDGTLNVEWFRKHDYDEGQIALAQANLDQSKKFAEFQQQFESLQQISAEQQRERDLNDFHDSLDRLDGEWFGKTLNDRGEPVQISATLGERRQAVFAQLDVASESLTRKLGHPPTMSQRVQLAAQLAWGSELAEVASRRSEAARKGQITKIANQARKVRPVSAPAKIIKSKPADPESTDAILNDPEMQAMLSKIAETNAS